MEVRAERMDAMRDRRTRAKKSKRLAMTLALTAVVAVSVGAVLGLRSHQSSEEITAQRQEQSEGSSGSMVDELLSDPAVREMLQGERVEAAAARANR